MSYSPYNPSPKAVSQVPPANRIEIPKVCNCCGAKSVKIKTHEQVYGSNYGKYNWMLQCEACKATVGFHPFTNIPLGYLADKMTRQARMDNKNWFLSLIGENQLFPNRGKAYKWLAKEMGIDTKDCHFGMFTFDQCQKINEILTKLEIGEVDQ